MPKTACITTYGSAVLIGGNLRRILCISNRVSHFWEHMQSLAYQLTMSRTGINWIVYRATPAPSLAPSGRANVLQHLLWLSLSTRLVDWLGLTFPFHRWENRCRKAGKGPALKLYGKWTLSWVFLACSQLCAAVCWCCKMIELSTDGLSYWCHWKQCVQDDRNPLHNMQWLWSVLCQHRLAHDCHGCMLHLQDQVLPKAWKQNGTILYISIYISVCREIFAELLLS